MREFVVLGTASQVPTRTRNHNGYLLRWDDEDILFDPGEGTQRQMIHAGVSTSRITRICLTHVHGDHCYGLPGVLSRMALDKVNHPVHLHYPASGEDVVRALVSVSSPGIDLRLHPHGGFAYGGIEHSGPGHRAAEPIAPGLYVRALDHRIEAYGYRLVEPDARTLLPDRLAAAGIAGPDVGRLEREGRLGGVSLAEVSVPAGRPAVRVRHGYRALPRRGRTGGRGGPSCHRVHLQRRRRRPRLTVPPPHGGAGRRTGSISRRGDPHPHPLFFALRGRCTARRTGQKPRRRSRGGSRERP